MSTEYEGNEGAARQSATPSAPPVPPVPPVAPEGPPPPHSPQAQDPGPAAPADSVPPTPATPPAAPAEALSAPPAPAVPAAPPAHTPPVSPPPPPAPAAHTAPAAPPPPAPQQPGAGTDTGTAAYPAGEGWASPPPPAPAATPSTGFAAPAHGGGDGPVWGAQPPPDGAKPPRKRGTALVTAVLVAALVAGGVGGAAGYWAASERNEDSSSTTVTSSEIPKDLKRAPDTVAAVAAKALPSVVTIEAKSSGGEGRGDLPGGSQGGGGTGTGFVYDQQGHILTNNHVVATAAEGGTLAVTFSNGREYDAEVVGRAEGYDVAVLKLKTPPAGLTPLPLGDSEKVAVGDSTIAIGAPFGLSNTVTTGIISAKNRPVASGDGSGTRGSYMSALQTDASINPGNSGGPLLDSRGAVIGINSAIQSTGGALGQAGSIGLGFAIPINQAKNVGDQLIKTGKPVYPVIGATVGMSESTEGAKIADRGTDGTPAVPPSGPAAKAGLKPGDIITKFDDKPIDSGPTLISEIWNHKPGDKVTLTYERGGKESTVTLTLGSRTGDS
ncbi:trypsin-like peptidase domain-containing protein [Streptomyces sp. NPDC006798]|uniref:S1C family serine protease n=1 Tax=Streptomyces sp. NPDC006798 TaxID=3155462 RepID=UPI0033F019F7